MKFAIIGSGISGLACAHLLKKNHEVVLFEAANKPGGHVNTVDVKGRTGDYRVDTGFIVFNEQNYPNFVRLLEKSRCTITTHTYGLFRTIGKNWD